MNNKDMNSIFEQINNLKKPAAESKEKAIDTSKDIPICFNLISAKYKMVKLFQE